MGLGGCGLESHMDPARPVAPEQLDAFLHYQFFGLTPADVRCMLEFTAGMTLDLGEVNERADVSAHESFKGRLHVSSS